MKKILTFLIPTLLFSGVASAEVSAETAFVFNTFLFVFSGVLVMFMALGFAMLEAGFVRKKKHISNFIKKYSIILNCRDNVLSYRLQFNVCRCFRLDRFIRWYVLRYC